MINLPDENREPISMTIPMVENREKKPVIINYNDGTSEEVFYDCIIQFMGNSQQDTCKVSVMGQAIVCMAATTSIICSVADLLEEKPRKAFALALTDLAKIIAQPGSAEDAVRNQTQHLGDDFVNELKNLLNKFKKDEQ